MILVLLSEWHNQDIIQISRALLILPNKADMRQDNQVILQDSRVILRDSRVILRGNRVIHHHRVMLLSRGMPRRRSGMPPSSRG